MIHTEQHRRQVFLTLIFSLLLLAAAFLFSIASGDVSLTPLQLGKVLLGQGTETEKLVLLQFRLPRILTAILAGAGLAAAGAILQGITRNPLADPGILGINAGAGLMVVISSTFFAAASSVFLYILPFFALIGGGLTAIIIYALSYKRGEGMAPNRLVLIGVGMAAAISGVILTLTARLDRNQYDFIANWMAGKIWGDDWPFVFALLPWIFLLIPAAFLMSTVLNLLNLDENTAGGLGVSIERKRRILLLIAVALASASVSVSGGIAFIGMMAPHIARSLVGPRHQGVLPVSALFGAILLLFADTIGRVLLDPSGIPAGIIVTIIGAPYFIYLLIKK